VRDLERRLRRDADAATRRGIPPNLADADLVENEARRRRISALMAARHRISGQHQKACTDGAERRKVRVLTARIVRWLKIVCMKIALHAALLLTLVPATARAQINAGEQKPEPDLPFTMTRWRRSNCPGGWPFCPMGACSSPKSGTSLAGDAAGREDAG
jgi:hypothetical protein